MRETFDFIIMVGEALESLLGKGVLGATIVDKPSPVERHSVSSLRVCVPGDFRHHLPWVVGASTSSSLRGGFESLLEIVVPGVHTRRDISEEEAERLFI